MELLKYWRENCQRDYHKGVELLKMVCSNTFLIKVYENRSPRFAIDSLEYDLRKYAAGKEVSVSDAKVDVETPAEPAAKKGRDAEEPTSVTKAKKIVHELWVEISKLNQQLYDVGTGNSEEDKKARVKIMEKRDPLITKYNLVYETKEAYFDGKITIEQLKEIVDGKKEEVKVEDFTSLSDLEVVRKLKAARMAVTRAENWLNYSQETKGKKRNPLPASPKREMWEKKRKEKEMVYRQLLAEKKRRRL